MGMKTVRRLAASILKVGENRVKFDPAKITKAQEALTHDDVRSLVKDGAIFAERKNGVSRIRAKIRHAQKKKGRQRGSGKRKGTFAARIRKRVAWKLRVRKLRKYFKELRSEGRLEPAAGRKIYGMIKGGAFKGQSYLEKYLQDNNLLKTAKTEAKK